MQQENGSEVPVTAGPLDVLIAIVPKQIALAGGGIVRPVPVATKYR